MNSTGQNERMNAHEEVQWRVEQALRALVDWISPGHDDTRRAAATVQALLLPALHRDDIEPKIAGVLQEVVYFASQAERDGQFSCPRRRVTDLLYLALDFLPAPRA